MIDLSLLQDFITETGEHLEEMETNLLQLEAAPDDQNFLNEIFRSAHTIKGSSEYLGMERIALLSHKLENLLEILRQGRTKRAGWEVNQDIIDTLIDARDRIAMLMADVEKNHEEKTEIDDLIERIDQICANPDGQTSAGEDFTGDSDSLSDSSDLLDISSFEEDSGMEEESEDDDEIQADYDEEYDKELFEIFIQYLQENLLVIIDKIARLKDSSDPYEILDKCLPVLSSLHSSANYMDYEKITRLYEKWQSAIESAKEAIKRKNFVSFKGADGSAMDIAEGMESYVRALADHFPGIKHLITGLEPEEKAPEKKEGEPTILPEPESGDGDGLDESDLPPIEVLDDEDITEDAEKEPVMLSKLKEDFKADLNGLYDELDTAFEPDVDEEEDITIMEAEAGPDQKDMEEKWTALEAGDSGQEDLKDKNKEPSIKPEISEKKVAPEKKFSKDQEIARLPKEQEKEEKPGSQEKIYTPDKKPVKTKEHPEVKAVKQNLRVDARKIDDLMNQVGELVVSRAWFSQLFSEMKELQDHLEHNVGLNQRDMKPVKNFAFRISEAIVALGRVANELQEGVMKVRMLPISRLFNRYPRLVRDLVHDTDKKVRLEMTGEDTELDKMVIEEISDPLVHIIRNAVDHGCETVEERRRAGKPDEAVLHLKSYHESNHVVIEISDDGRGLDLEKIKKVALGKKLITEDDLKRISGRELMAFIMKPGFSTSSEVTKTSGRGVGMDVVKKNLEKLNGTIEIHSIPGRGTRFRIKIPLTLAIIQALLVRVGDNIFTIPLTAVEETLRIFRRDVTLIEGVECIYLRDRTLSLLRLSKLFGIRSEAESSDKMFVVVVNTGMKQVGFVVDALIGQEEAVIKPFVDYLQENSGFSGATILGDGRISLILDVYELINLSMSANDKIHGYMEGPLNAAHNENTDLSDMPSSALIH